MDLADLTLTDAAAGLRARDFSSVDYTRALLSRAEAAAGLNCFVTLDASKALAAARDADAGLSRGGDVGRLAGVPLGVKDLILTEGLRTTSCSRILENFIPPYDATVVRRYKDAGAFCLGKTNMDEFAMGSSTENSAFGPTRNPWDLAKVPGGSSGGSAAAVAARLCPAALGSDTGGSIRQPAAFCGVVGLKPTYGRVSRYGVVAFASSLDQVGVFARTVRDAALLTDVVSGHDPLDATSVRGRDAVSVPGPEVTVRGLRIGVPDEYFVPGLPAEIRGAVDRVLEVLTRLGAEAVRISLPHTEAAVSVYYVIAPAEASSNLARYDGIRFGRRAEGAKDLRDLYVRTRSEGFGPEVKRRILLGSYVLSEGHYDAYYAKAQKVRALVAKDFAEAFRDRCDVILAPTTPTPAFGLGEKLDDPVAMYLNDVFTIPASLAGLPGASVPCAPASGDASAGPGLPVGFQLIGRPWEESTVLRAAAAYEDAAGTYPAPPPSRAV